MDSLCSSSVSKELIVLYCFNRSFSHVKLKLSSMYFHGLFAWGMGSGYARATRA